MKKSNNFMRAMAIILVVAVTLVLAACGPKGTKYQITWEIPEHATVNVDEKDKLPSEALEGEELVFSITLDSGYQVKSVKANSKRIAKKNEKYTVKIEKETTIKIDVEKKVTGIEVVSNPTDLTYFAGESLDTTGMVVKAKYADNSEAVIEKGVNGYTVSPSTFEGGETSFKVMYNGFEKEIQLENKVEYLVTIDPTGGKVSDAWVENLRNMRLNNVDVNEKGVVTFSYYDNLLAPIKLPTSEEVIYENHTLLGWSSNDEITNATRSSVNVSANWQAELVDIQSVEIVMENDKPLLVVKGKFKLADEVYLRLYEGNKDLGIIGATYKNTEGVGSEFKTIFDLTELSGYVSESGETLEGAWMDIRFNAVIDDKEESMEVFIGEGSTVAHDLNQKLQTADHTYSFAEWGGFIKVYYNTKHYTYNISFEAADNTDYLVIEGTTATKYANKNIQISWWFENEEHPINSSAIDANGNFKIKVNLKEIPNEKHGWAHVTIYDTDAESPIYGGLNVNLAMSQCVTELADVKINGTGINRALKYVNASGISFYAGTESDGLMLYQINESKTLDYKAFDLELIDGHVYFVVSGNYTGYAQDELKIFFDMEHHGDNGESGKLVEKTECIVELDTANHTFKAKFDATANAAEGLKAASVDVWRFWIHLGIEEKFGDVRTNETSSRVIIQDGIEYKLFNGDGTWGLTNLIMTKTNEANSQKYLAYTGAEIKNVDGKAMLTITGEAFGYTVDYFNQLKPQLNGMFNNNDNWSVVELPFTVKIENNVLTIECDITSLEVGGHTVKIDVEGNDFLDLKVGNAIDQKIEVGNKHFTLVGVPGSGEANEFWGCLGIIVANVNVAE